MSAVQSAGVLVASNRASYGYGGMGGYGGPSIGANVYRGEHVSYAALYRTQPNLRTCIELIARNLAQLPWALFGKDTNGDVVRLDDHPAMITLRRPAPNVTRHRWLHDFVSDLLIYDDAFALMAKAPTSGRLGLFRMPPWMMAPADQNWPDAGSWRFLGNKEQPVFPSEQVFHVHGYNPSDTRIGTSPIETLRQIVAEDVAAGEYREQLWNKGARTSGVIERPPDAPEWSPTARKRFREEWEAAWAGSGLEAGGTPVLEEGMKFTQAVTSFAEAEYLGARKLSRQECAASYFLDPSLIGAGEQTRTPDATKWDSFYANTLPPLLDQLEEEFELQVLPAWSDLRPETGENYVKFDIADKLRGKFTEQADVLSRMVGGPYVLRAEARAMLDLPKLKDDEADKLIVPMNVTQGGRANPADTAPGTPGLGQVGEVGDYVPPGKAALRRSREIAAKAREMPHSMSVWLGPHVDAYTNMLGRQKQAVLSALGAGDTPNEAFDSDRWNRELKSDLHDLAFELAAAAAKPIADALGAKFDVDLAEAWLENNARIAAETFNQKTLLDLHEAYADVGAKTLGVTRSKATAADVADLVTAGTLSADRLDAARDVFKLALEVRAAKAGLGRVTQVGNFSRNEAAQQAGAGKKTWVVTSANPRASHASMDGETVALGEEFSNGGKWPGDPSLDTDELSGCTCTVEFSHDGD